MAGWISVFKVIPWTDLIMAAPAVVRGARQLWSSVRHRDAASAAGKEPEERLSALEAQLEELRKELAMASELMAKLAEQNSRLVEAMAVLRMRMRALLVLCAVMAIALAGLGVAVMK